jgi:hypothetical protein
MTRILDPYKVEALAEAAWAKTYASTDDWYSTWKSDYLEGYRAYHLSGLGLDGNPNELSHHERDTTYSDEAHFQWDSGWSAAFEEANP